MEEIKGMEHYTEKGLVWNLLGCWRSAGEGNDYSKTAGYLGDLIYDEDLETLRHISFNADGSLNTWPEYYVAGYDGEWVNRKNHDDWTKYPKTPVDWTGFREAVEASIAKKQEE